MLHCKNPKQYANAITQFVKFGLVGVSNTVLSYFTYAIVCMLGGSFHLGNILGFIVSVTNSFYWNNKYVFKAKENEKRIWWKALIKTYISYSFSGLILTEILLILWIRVLGISQYIAPILNLFITVPLNFFLNKMWAFKSEKR